MNKILLYKNIINSTRWKLTYSVHTFFSISWKVPRAAKYPLPPIPLDLFHSYAWYHKKHNTLYSLYICIYIYFIPATWYHKEQNTLYPLQISICFIPTAWYHNSKIPFTPINLDLFHSCHLISQVVPADTIPDNGNQEANPYKWESWRSEKGFLC